MVAENVTWKIRYRAVNVIARGVLEISRSSGQGSWTALSTWPPMPVTHPLWDGGDAALGSLVTDPQLTLSQNCIFALRSEPLQVYENPREAVPSPPTRELKRIGVTASK